MSPYIKVALSLAISIAALWTALVVALLIARPRGDLIKEAFRLLPDTLRLIHRLAKDRTLPRSLRVRLWLLLGYLAMPFDLIPDFIPVLGQADDVIFITLVVRSVVRKAGFDSIRRHWPGSDEGLAALLRLMGINQPTAATSNTPPHA